MISTDNVRREVEHIKRSLNDQQRNELASSSLEKWIPGYYANGRESQLLMFVKKYPVNDTPIRDYICGHTKKYRVTTKRKGA